MTTPDIEPEVKEAPIPAEVEDIHEEVGEEEVEKDERKRRLLLLLLLLLLLCLCCVAGLFLRYLLNPQPLPQLIPFLGNVAYPPTYKFSFPADRPVGVAVSPDGQRIYVAESVGQRYIKIFDRNGNLLDTFAPPFTNQSNRKPHYVAVDAAGRVFVTDTYNDTVAMFDADGNFLDAIVAQDTSLSELVAAEHGGSVPAGALFYYSNITQSVEYQIPGETEKRFIPFEHGTWSPVGVRFDRNGNLLVTNIVVGVHEVLSYPAAAMNDSWLNFSAPSNQFGKFGEEGGEFSFPNAVVTDRRGNYYVSDGNNGRISTWTPEMLYEEFFGFGSSESTLNLPRGMWMSEKDHLHVADAVGQYIRVYDVSGEESAFLFNFGVFGDGDGEFNFPVDICMDGTGRLYIADRENNRIQVWSY